MSSIDDIAKGMEQPGDSCRLTISEAINLLGDKVSKTSDIFKCVLNVTQSLTDFVSGQCSISDYRERTEALTEAADDVLNLVCAVLDRPAVNRADFYGHEIALMESIDFVNSAYRLRDVFKQWASKVDDVQLLESATEFAQYAHALYRSASLFETSVGSTAKLDFNPQRLTEDTPSRLYDEALLESCVGTGAIAIRPAILPSKPSKNKDIFPTRPKRRWYHKYVIER